MSGKVQVFTRSPPLEMNADIYNYNEKKLLISFKEVYLIRKKKHMSNCLKSGKNQQQNEEDCLSFTQYVVKRKV